MHLPEYPKPVRLLAAMALLLAASSLWAQPLPAVARPTDAVQPAPAARSAGSSSSTPTGISSTAAVSATVSMEVLDDSRALTVGDAINLRIVEDGDPPVTLQIKDSGNLEVPYVGPVRAAGLTPRRLAYAIKSELQRDYYHNATVIIGLDTARQQSAGLFYITGMVNSPGPQEIPTYEALTVSKAILRAGGFSNFANQRKVKLTRAGPGGQTDTQIIDVKEIIERGRLDLDVEIRPNDFIVVPERLINF
jgi:protein involved in polysaccharide export with SLBB domain